MSLFLTTLKRQSKDLSDAKEELSFQKRKENLQEGIFIVLNKGQR